MHTRTLVCYDWIGGCDFCAPILLWHFCSLNSQAMGEAKDFVVPEYAADGNATYIGSIVITDERYEYNLHRSDLECYIKQ